MTHELGQSTTLGGVEMLHVLTRDQRELGDGQQLQHRQALESRDARECARQANGKNRPTQHAESIIVPRRAERPLHSPKDSANQRRSCDYEG